MSKSLQLLDAYKRRSNITSDNAAATALKVSRQAISKWRTGENHPDADSVEKMTDAIGEPVGPWLAQIEAERARTPASRTVWLRLAATLGTTLALAVTALPSHAHEQTSGRLNVQTLPIV